MTDIENTVKDSNVIDDIWGSAQEVKSSQKSQEIGKSLLPETPVVLEFSSKKTTDKKEQSEDEVLKLAEGLARPLPKLMKFDNLPVDFENVVKRILLQYDSLPVLNYNELYAELAELSVKSCPTPTLDILNRELCNVQAAKDRLSEIFINVLRNYTFKKRAVDILTEAWGNFSNGKSADKRKSEAVYLISDFDMDFAETDALFRAISVVIKNLDSIHESLSRRITIIQVQLKMQDVGRSSLPDFSFDKAQTVFDAVSATNSKDGTKPDVLFDDEENKIDI
jgi:hypothetical protein